MKNRIILTFDLEFWYNSKFLERYMDINVEDYIYELTFPVLDMLRGYNIKATFFVLGKLAEKYPDIVERVFQDGHEIASHGYSHRTLDEITKEEFDNEISLSNTILKEITGKEPIGFRAPVFSLNNNTSWALEVLEKYGFKYDSSIFPFKTPLYGSFKAPLKIYRISKENVYIEDRNSEILEFP